MPVTPWVTTSSGPVTGYAATGTPQAMASSSTSPNVSVRLEKCEHVAGRDVRGECRVEAVAGVDRLGVTAAKAGDNGKSLAVSSEAILPISMAL